MGGFCSFWGSFGGFVVVFEGVGGVLENFERFFEDLKVSMKWLFFNEWRKYGNRFWVFLGWFWGGFRVFLGVFLGCFWGGAGWFWGGSGVFLGCFLGGFEVVLGCFLGGLGCFWGGSGVFFGCFLGVFGVVLRWF